MVTATPLQCTDTELVKETMTSVMKITPRKMILYVSSWNWPNKANPNWSQRQAFVRGDAAFLVCIFSRNTCITEKVTGDTGAQEESELAQSWGALGELICLGESPLNKMLLQASPKLGDPFTFLKLPPAPYTGTFLPHRLFFFTWNARVPKVRSQCSWMYQGCIIKWTRVK